MNKTLHFTLLATTLTCFLLSTSAKAQDADTTTDTDAKAERLEFMKSSAESIEVKVAFAGDREVTAKLEGPVQRWSHPISPAIPDATVFLWTVDSRPVVAVQVFYMGGFPNWSQEFTVMTDRPVTATDKGKQFWATKANAVTPLKLEGLPRVASRDTLRLTQMRAIARKFDAVHRLEEDSPTNLKVLPTPLYRFKSESARIVDGAVFSLASGIDPEILLLIEAVGDESESRWQVSAAPMTIFACRMKWNDEVVWKTEYRLPPHKIDSTFMYHNYLSEGQPLVEEE